MSEVSRPIALVTIEEHHEAFVVWHVAIRNRIVNRSKNALLHVDHHSDLATPKLKTSPDDLWLLTKEALQQFTYEELTISNFILPAIYQGIFGQVIWIDQYCPDPTKHGIGAEIRSDPVEKGLREHGHVSACILSESRTGKDLKLDTAPPASKAEDRCLRQFEIWYRRLPMEDAPPINRHEDWVLDVDLDYFSCIHDPSQLISVKLGVSLDTYRELQNPYHPFSLHLNLKPRLTVEEGNYYAVFGEVDPHYASLLRVNEEEIIRRIDTFVEFLSTFKSPPSLITICRSRYSGFTPCDQWEFIERHLTDRIERLYPLDKFGFDDFRL